MFRLIKDYILKCLKIEATEEETDCFLDKLELPSLTVEQNQLLITDITENDVKRAITKFKSNKSPGPDGFTGKWYIYIEHSKKKQYLYWSVFLTGS